MQTTVELQDMFSYLPIGPIGILVLCVAVILYVLIKHKKPKKPPVVKTIQKESIAVIKQKYAQMLLQLEYAYQEKQISERAAYQELSKVVRHFVYDATGIRVQNYTLDEIRQVNMPNLYYLIAECYVPEFATENEADFVQTIGKARKVMEQWN